MEKTFGLLQMGFTNEEVSSAIDTFGKSRIKNAKFCPMLPDSSEFLMMMTIFIRENLFNAICLPFSKVLTTRHRYSYVYRYRADRDMFHKISKIN
jgi:hypothetical protein